MSTLVTSRGFGVSSLVPHDVVGELAPAAESAGYAMFWVNDLPGASGLASLGVAATAAPGIELGVGVLAVDRWTVEATGRAVAEAGVDPARLTIGMGAGQLTTGAVDAMREACEGLLRLGARRVVVGSLGPRMTRLGGTDADGVLLNWVTPTAAADLATVAIQGGRETRRPTWVSSYTRVAMDTGAAGARLNAECSAYESYPAYARHFERFGVTARETTVLGQPLDIQGWLDGFDGIVDHVVVRAIAAGDTCEDYLAVLRAAAPGSRGGAD